MGSISGTSVTGAQFGRTKIVAYVDGIFYVLPLEVVPKGYFATPKIAIGSNHTVALKADGTVWTWGLNNYGQLGNGTRWI